MKAGVAGIVLGRGVDLGKGCQQEASRRELTHLDGTQLRELNRRLGEMCRLPI